MKQLFVKPIAMVLLLIVVPSALLTVFQLNSINQQEDAFERIYERQLKSVILSLNMYADDVVGQWASKVANLWQEEKDGNAELVDFVNGNSQIQGAVLYAFSEETGFLGALILISLFLIFAWRGFKIIKAASDKFSGLLALGIIFWISSQAFINIGSMIGILPLTGIPLPFISYGGSHIVAELIGLGILLNISKNI